MTEIDLFSKFLIGQAKYLIKRKSKKYILPYKYLKMSLFTNVIQYVYHTMYWHTNTNADTDTNRIYDIGLCICSWLFCLCCNIDRIWDNNVCCLNENDVKEIFISRTLQVKEAKWTNRRIICLNFICFFLSSLLLLLLLLVFNCCGLLFAV